MQEPIPILCNPKPDPLNDVARLTLRPHDGVQTGLSGEYVGLGGVHPLGALEDLPEEEEAEVDGDSDIVGDEAVDLEAAGDGVETVEEDDQAEEDEAEPGEVRLEGGLENEGIAINALRTKGLVELDIGNANRAPGEDGADGSQVLEPRECLTGACGSGREVGEEADDCSEGDAPVRHARLGAAKQEPWRLPVLGQGEKHSRSGIQERVGRRGGRGQDHGVDDRWQGWDTGTVDGDNPWGLSSTGSSGRNSVQEVGVIVRDEHANGKCTKDVEEKDTPEDTSDGLWDVAARILSLSGSDCHHLNSSIRESSIDKGGPQTQEATSIASGNVGLHGAWVLPVSESEPVVGWRSAEVDDKGKEQEADDRDDLDGREDELGLTVDRHSEDVQADDKHHDEGDPGGNVDVLGSLPELDDGRGGRDLSAQSEGVGVPVVPAHGEAHRVVDIPRTELGDGSGQR